MPGKTNLRLIACFGLLLLSHAAGAQDSSRLINGRLLGLDGSPQRDYVLQSKRLQTKATASEEGKFSLKVNREDSLLILFQETQLGAIKVPDFDHFQVQFAQNNKFKITPLSAEAAKDSSKPAADTTVPALPKDTVSKATQKDTVLLPVAKDTALPGITVKDTAALQDTVFVTGKVTDITGKPVAFVNIAYSNGKTYSSKEDGSFQIPFKAGATVTFSAVGYTEKPVVLVSALKPLPVQLNSTSGRRLQEVRVTAMGISKKGRAVGYAVQEVKGEVVQVAKEPSFVNALQGKLAGVQINGNSGSMSGSSKVTIRGNKSITGDNNALFVIDGVFMGNNNPVASYNQQIGGGGYDYGSPIQDINPDDIEQISVLKGAAATVLYGSRGSNGVVLITTRKGSASKKLGISYSLNAQMDKVYMRTRYQNRYGAGGAVLKQPGFVASGFDTLWYNKNPEQFLSSSAPTYTDPVNGGYDLMPQYGVDESWGPALNGQIIRPYYSFDKQKNNPYFGQTTSWLPQPDNVKNFYRTGITVTNSLSVSGGSDKGTFRLSYSNLTQKFVLPNSDLKRNNLGLNGTYKLNDIVTAVASANYSVNSATGRPGTGFAGTNPTQLFTMFGQRQLEIDKLKYEAFPDGSQVSWNRKAFNDPTPASATTPYWTANRGYESDSRTRLYGLAGFDAKPTSWLSLSAKVFMDEFTTLLEERSPKDYQAGGYTRTDRTFRELNYLFLASIKRDLSKKFDLNATVGGNIMQRKDQINTGVVPGLIVPGLYTFANSNGRVTYTPYLFNKQINSVFGDVTLGYDNTVFLNLTGRNDWSSTLPKNNNSYFYPSASLSVVFSDWLKANWLSMGKVRTSLSQIGSDTDPYRTNLAYAQPGLFGSTPVGALDQTLNNAGLKPERSTELEAGIELKFLNNRIGLDATIYNRTTKDLIIPLTITQATGYNSYFANVGKSRNRGVEVELSARPVELKNSFAWDLGVNFSMNRSRLLELNVPNNKDFDTYLVGTERRLNSVSTAAIVGQPLFVLKGTDYTYDANGNKKVDATGNYIPSAPGQIIGTTQPDFIGGVSNTFSYKNISLSALVDFQKGGNFFSYTNLYGLYSGTLAETVEGNIRENGIIVPGIAPDGNANAVRISAPDYFKGNFGRVINKANIYDAGFVYLREVRLGFTLPEKWTDKIGAVNARLSLYGRNLWLMHANAPNVDPSNIINSDSNIQGLEGGALPSVRSFGVNLNIGF